MSQSQTHSPKSNTASSHASAAVLGTTRLARGLERNFQIASHDLDEHFYVIGRSGTGKSNLLKELAIADAERGAGLCFIDPIGNTADDLITHLGTRHDAQWETALNRDQHSPSDASEEDAPRRDPSDDDLDVDDVRQAIKASAPLSDKDIIYFDAADVEFPIGINPLYNVPPADRARAVSDILQMFSSVWHDSGWGARMESIFRASLHTLVENPNCMRPSLLTVFRLLLDETFRSDTKSAIDNEQVLDWWNYRFDRGDLNERTRREWVEPVLNKIDTLSLDPVIRNIIGQPRCLLDFEEIIRRRQALVVNLNQNRIGRDNATFIGMLIISQIRQAAARVGKRDAPFALTIDEAPSFPTMELTKIIDQGRHSGLFARIALQNIEQFNPKISASLRNGCGSIAVFAVGNKDADVIVDDFGSQHRQRALGQINHLAKGECILRLTLSGSPESPLASPITVNHRRAGKRSLASGRNATRERFATPRLRAEFQIARSHQPMDRETHLHWKEKFRQERKNKKQQHRITRSNRETNRDQQLDTAFGGAARMLQAIKSQMEGSCDVDASKTVEPKPSTP